MYVRITLSNSTSVVPSGCVNDAGETILTPHENPEGEKKMQFRGHLNHGREI